MDLPYIAALAFALIILASAVFVALKFRRGANPIEKTLMELAGELKLSYYGPIDGKPPFATGLYSGRGVTFDLLNERAYMDRWHPHSRVVVGVDRNVKDTHIVAYRGRFYSRKMGEVQVDNKAFMEKYILLSTSPHKAAMLISPEVAEWIVNLDMPFTLSDGHVIFHQDRHIEDKTRVKHILDALVYIASLVERIR